MITQQGVQCGECGDRIFSNFRHDFNRCRCGATFVDGGFDYVRAGFKGAPPTNITRSLKARPKRYFRRG